MMYYGEISDIIEDFAKQMIEEMDGVLNCKEMNWPTILIVYHLK